MNARGGGTGQFGASPRVVDLSSLARPVVILLVDLEEEFDWRKPFARENTGVTHLQALPSFQARLESRGIRPTYLADYPVVASDAGSSFLADVIQRNAAEVGAQLHPWVNPPHEEPISTGNSYHGNLPSDLERRKVEQLTRLIGERCGNRPRAFKAGRYGLGPNTLRIIADAGYEVDTSVMPYTSYRDEGGPDYSHVGHQPFWVDEAHRLLELPSTRAFAGKLRHIGPRLHQLADRPWGRSLRLTGVLARLGLLERITLSPEGASHDDHRRLVDAMLAAGQKIFIFSFHSPSLAAGHTPYVRSEADLAEFLKRIERFFDWMLGSCNAVTMSALEFRASLDGKSKAAD